MNCSIIEFIGANEWPNSDNLKQHGHPPNTLPNRAQDISVGLKLLIDHPTKALVTSAQTDLIIQLIY